LIKVLAMAVLFEIITILRAYVTKKKKVKKKKMMVIMMVLVTMTELITMIMTMLIILIIIIENCRSQEIVTRSYGRLSLVRIIDCLCIQFNHSSITHNTSNRLSALHNTRAVSDCRPICNNGH
jgi:uncharacterized membrane protein